MPVNPNVPSAGPFNFGSVLQLLHMNPQTGRANIFDTLVGQAMRSAFSGLFTNRDPQPKDPEAEARKPYSAITDAFRRTRDHWGVGEWP